MCLDYDHDQKIKRNVLRLTQRVYFLLQVRLGKWVSQLICMVSHVQ